MKKQEIVIEVLEIGSDHLHKHLLSYCEKLLDEQRKLNIQLALSKACYSFRGIKKLSKEDIEEFFNKINKISFIETETVKVFKKDLLLSIEIFNNYYDKNTGIRKSKKTR